MNKLLTRQDLAERWQVDVTTIANWRKEGILQPAEGIPAIRFTEQYVAELEGIRLEKFSPLQRRKMESELEKLKKENAELKKTLSNILAESIKLLNLI